MLEHFTIDFSRKRITMTTASDERHQHSEEFPHIRMWGGRNTEVHSASLCAFLLALWLFASVPRGWNSSCSYHEALSFLI